MRRKYNLVQRVSKSSYRVVLENTSGVDHFQPRRGLDNETFVLAGGGFPIRVKGAGMIGCVIYLALFVLHIYCIIVAVGGKRPNIPVITDFAQKSL